VSGEPGAKHDVVGALIGALVGAGHEVDEGGFTLDREAAFRKLRGYQLGNRLEYLLIFVEAAWAAEPSDKTRLLTIECRADTYVDFRGPSFEPAELRELFAAVFSSPRGLEGEALRRARVLQLLGLAVNHALPNSSGGVSLYAHTRAGARVRLHLERDGSLIVDDRAPEPNLMPGWIRTQVHGDGNLARGFAERALVTQRCRYASFPVHVDNGLVSKRPRAGLSRRKPVELDGATIGEAGYRGDQAAELLVVNRGVEFAVPLPQLPAGFTAIVAADLPMDLSRSQLVDGPELAAIRAAVEASAAAVGPAPRVYSRVAAPHTDLGVKIVTAAFALIGLLITLAVLSTEVSR
jgi:hypothetical protein